MESLITTLFPGGLIYETARIHHEDVGIVGFWYIRADKFALFA